LIELANNQQIEGHPMSLTDATKLIKRDKTDKKQTGALKKLKTKLEVRKKMLQKQMADTDRGLKKIHAHLGS
jgi:hypothetical protein